MSREEAKEKEKAEMSDKLRLEMALKESAEVAAKVMAKHSPNHSNDATSSQSVDPWGASLTQPQENTFDPFASKAPTDTSGFGTDAWSAQSSMPSQSGNLNAFDPWGGTTAGQVSTGQPTYHAIQSTNQASQPTNQAATDLWGASTKPSSLSSGPQATKSNDLKLDPWGSGEQVSQGVDPWNANTTTAVSSDPWSVVTNSNSNAGLSSGAGDSFDPFSTAAPPPTSDPLTDFGQLSLQSSQTASATLDLFSSDVMVPQTAGGSTDAGTTSLVSAINAAESNKAGAFLGNNASLVNIDNLIAKPPSNHPYITMNTGGGPIGGSRNPFNQKGPSMSLNQMKTDTKTPFSLQSNVSPAANTFPPSTVPPMGFDMSLGTYVPAHQSFGMPGGMQSTANIFAPQTLQSNSANQPNQLLF